MPPAHATTKSGSRSCCAGLHSAALVVMPGAAMVPLFIHRLPPCANNMTHSAYLIAVQHLHSHHVSCSTLCGLFIALVPALLLGPLHALQEPCHLKWENMCEVVRLQLRTCSFYPSILNPPDDCGSPQQLVVVSTFPERAKWQTQHSMRFEGEQACMHKHINPAPCSELPWKHRL